MDTIISTVLFIVALGLLICLHELGHFFFAKLFGVYCAEFSIGFGPALIHKKGKNKETYFSLRAIPLGGYVAMYGEEGEPIAEEDNLPPERSLEGIKKWKKGIIISAGIVVNTIISILLIGISNFCFPITISSNVVRTNDSCVVSVQEDERLNFTLQDEGLYFSYQFTNDDGVINAGVFAIIDDNVEFNSKNYVLVYTPVGTKNDTDLSDGVKLYAAISKEEVKNDTGAIHEIYKNWVDKEDAPEYFPNVLMSNFLFDEDTSFNADLTFIKDDDRKHAETVTFVVKNKSVQSIGVYLKSINRWLPMNQRWQNTWQDFGNASMAVFSGLKTLFSRNGLKNVSGLVGIFSYSGELYSNYTFATYLYFWGMISINLAIFNLLPFPGLDGWQLLVTVVEGISKKKLPKKFKSIMSFVGLALLMVLMFIILVLDIVKIV